MSSRAVSGTGGGFGDIAQMSFNSELAIDHSKDSIAGLRDIKGLRDDSLWMSVRFIDGFIHALFILMSPPSGSWSSLCASRLLCRK
jgi:hypothetical protein